MRSVKYAIQEFKKTKKSSLIVYAVLRILIILSLIGQLIRGNYEGAFLCFLALILMILPFFIQKRFKITLPSLLEIIIFLFIFSAQILGEIHNFYGQIQHWDTMLHTLNGFLAAGVGFALVDLLNRNSKSVNLSPLFVAIVAFCFSMTIAVLWEFFEFSLDHFLRFDTQKDTIVQAIATVTLDPLQANNAIPFDNIARTVLYDAEGNVITVIEGGYLDIGLIDTMKDMIVNFIGAVVFSVLGFFYLKNRDKYKFAEHFIPKRQEE